MNTAIHCIQMTD